jgi:hypothetical protein
MTAKIFNINDLALKLSDEQVRALEESKRKWKEGKAATPVQNKKGRVVVVPFSWRERLKGPLHWAAWPLALHLLHLDWKAGRRPFKVTNPAAAEWGIDRWQKQAALEVLEKAGLIGLEVKPGKCPIVTILVR